MILPGSTIGVLGSGQLGRMFGLAARRMGYRVHTYSPEKDSPMGQIADKEWVGAYTNLKKIKAFAQAVDVVTFEFENIPAETVNFVARWVPVYPKARVLHITQHRLREKTFLSQAGFPVVPFAAVRSMRDLERALPRIGLPAVIKSAGFGYDGKGQRKVRTRQEALEAYTSLGYKECILEGFIDFQKEISVIAARTPKKTCVTYDVFENDHANHILDITFCPAQISRSVRQRALVLAKKVVRVLDVVGVMCVEMFLTKSGKILINELAPRPHNSGHLTIDACVTSQFEQQVRAVCGLPLGSARLRQPAAMANLLGDVWRRGTPQWVKALAKPDVFLHLYGKAKPRAGRKMGHLTVLASSADDARLQVRRARKSLLRS